MEYENHNFGSKGVAGAGLGLGIAGTALGVLSGGLGNIGGVFGNNARCNEDHYVNRYELALQKEIEAKNSRISLLESNIYVDSKLADVYERLNTKIGIVENQLCEQKVYNATLNGAVSCIQGQIAALQALTKNVIPITNICPQPATATTTTTGA